MTRLKEKVIHPDHYNWVPGIECLDVVKWFNFNLGSAMKYLWRCGRKENESMLDDLRKAKFYIETEIKMIEDNTVSNEEG